MPMMLAEALIGRGVRLRDTLARSRSFMNDCAGGKGWAAAIRRC